MFRVAYALLLLAVSAPSPAAAQSAGVDGIVLDHRTEQAIRGVLVYVEGQPVFTQTDDGGRFALELPAGEYTLVASVIGYALLRADVVVGAGTRVPVSFRLSAGAGTFADRITVSGVRLDRMDGPGAGAIYGRELENLRGGMLDDPLRALQALPTVTATDDFYSEFAVRGSTFRHVGLTVDAIPTRYLMHTVHGATDGGSIAMVNSETLSAITLLPGSYPQRNGRVLGAQVDLSTRDGNRDEFRGRAGVSGTSAAILGEGPLPGRRGSWLASFRKSYLGYLIQRIEPDASFVFGFIDAQAKVVYDVSPRHQLSAIALAGRAAFHEGAPDLGANDRARANSHAWLAGVSWRFLPSAQLAITQRLSSTGVDFNHLNPTGITLDGARAHDVGWRGDASYAPSPRWLVTFGGDAQRLASAHARVRVVSGAGRPVSEYDRHGAAASAYGQVRLSVGRVRIEPGARVDVWGATEARTASPWLSGEVRLSDRFTVRGGGGVYRQFPTLDQVYGVRGGGSRLRPEHAEHLDLGLDYSGPLRITLTAYRRLEEDVLWTPGEEPRRLPTRLRTGRIDTPWTNVLNGRARGVELLVHRDAPAGLAGWIGYAYGRHRVFDSSSGERFWSDADQRHTVAIYGTYRMSSRTSLSAKFRYGSNYPLLGYLGHAAPAAPVVDGRPQYYQLTTERNALRLPPYARLDARGERAFNWSGGRLVVFVEVANTLNRTNLRNSRYFVERSGRLFDATEPLMPIVPSAGFSVDF